MQVHDADEQPEVLILKEDLEDIKKDAILPEPSESVPVESDVVVLEESVTMSSAPVLTTAGPDTSSECWSGTHTQSNITI